jgi:hypothetical protein
MLPLVLPSCSVLHCIRSCPGPAGDSMDNTLTPAVAQVGAIAAAEFTAVSGCTRCSSSCSAAALSATLAPGSHTASQGAFGWLSQAQQRVRLVLDCAQGSTLV